ncbi:ABC transporter ATP-binding protein [Peptoclostridium sp. AF21-18]|uniref:ABC transporter ATP-binding protein n=1 Tax=Peptoclostridium sp. AF21-18 TaxID=2292243 RepID=UPI000E4792BF|nr:ABC transporter ATP-binding protein [Peptoclostridium sp. AF21-18]RHQ99187.1 ABC transporter ATP-binding protein [Peptoclostridium sp. AF21-18]
MLKIMKYLKKSAVSVVAIIILLLIQALCDISLPDYTSKIVNVGIQQGGIENAVPEVIKENELKRLLMFVDNDDKDTVEDAYTLVKSGDTSDENYDEYVEKYPKLETENVYVLKEIDKEKNEKLNEILGKPEMALLAIEKDGEESKKIKEGILKMMPPQAAMVMKDKSLIEIMKTMPEEQLDSIRKEMFKKFDSMPDSIITQSAIAYVNNEYKSIGIDLDNLQNKYILKSGGQMLGIAILSMFVTIIVTYLAAKVAATLGKILRNNVYEKVMSFSNEEMKKFSTASLITRSTNDIQQIQMMMVMILRFIFYAPMMAMMGIFKVINTNVSMSWIIGVAVLCIVFLLGILFTFVMPKFKLVQDLVDRLNLVSREIITGIMPIRAFSNQKHEEERFDKANGDLTKVNIFVNRIMSCMMPAMMLVMNLIAVLIVYKGTYSIDAGTMQVGDMMAFIQYTMQIIMSFLVIAMMSVMIPRASVSAGRICEVIETEPTIEDPKNAKEFSGNKKGVVEFKNVSFKYPDAEEEILSDISFTAKPGETTAFIGSTGSGKSTLINLIPRFFDVTEGQILVDGVDIREVTQKDLRDKIGYVPQKGILFTGTIASNLRYGNPDATDEEIREAAEIAQATEFIDSKPEGFDTKIAQGGTNVSGGQKQRLSIARAIAKNPEIYIFDDSFSALDLKTDAALRKALKKKTGDSTVLIVAQRISTILHAEQIIVLDEGKVIGKGTHEELLKTCEVYKQIALSQLSKEELGNE